MVNYTCYRCNYITNRKCNMKNHLSRINVCNAEFNIKLTGSIKSYILQGLSYLEYKELIDKKCINNNDLTNNTINYKKHTINCKNNTQNCKKNTLEYNTSNYECIYCGNIYNFNSGLHRHLKSCKAKKNEIELLKIKIDKLETENNKQIKEMGEKIEELTDIIEHKNIIINEYKNNYKMVSNTNSNNTNTTNTTNTTNNNTTNNYININSYKNTNFKCLTNDEIHSCLNQMAESYIELLEKIHFNNNFPENQNIYLSNVRLDTLKVHNGEHWTSVDKKEILTEIFDNFTGIFEDYLSIHEDNNTCPELLDKYYKYQNIIGEDNNTEYDNIFKKLIYRIHDCSKTMKNKPL